MGILRLLLALSVVIVHAVDNYGIPLVGGTVAVQTFYMISGFYMALILHEKYTGPNSYQLFISNRLLRLFPAYYAVLFLVVVISATRFMTAGTGGGPLTYFSDFSDRMGLGTKLTLIVANAVIVGQDVLMFFRIDPETRGLAFCPAFDAADAAGLGTHQFLFVPQAWTLGVELSFYLIAPFLVRRPVWILLGIIAASLTARFFTYGLGLNEDPWTYRFFPFELAFFLAGAVGYRAYVRWRNLKWAGKAGGVALVCAIVATFVFPYVPVPFGAKQWTYYGMMAAVIPLIFNRTHRNRTDRWIGELSYPVYISHVLVLRLIGNSLRFPYIPPEFLVPVGCAASIAFSVLLLKYIMEPIERIRRSRVAPQPDVKLEQH